MKYNVIIDKYDKERVRLSTRILDADEGGSPMFLIEGSAVSLRMIGEIFLAAAEEGKGDGFSISPRGAGRSYFSSSSTIGIYVNCVED